MEVSYKDKCREIEILIDVCKKGLERLEMQEPKYAHCASELAGYYDDKNALEKRLAILESIKNDYLRSNPIVPNSCHCDKSTACEDGGKNEH